MTAGSCLCQQIQYEALGEPVIVAHCFCVDCQKLSGAGHSTGAAFYRDNLSIQGQLSSYTLTADSGHQVTRSFCPHCGSSLFGQNDGMPEVITIAVGTMDHPGDMVPAVAVFDRNQCAWDIIPQEVQSYQNQPNWKAKP